MPRCCSANSPDFELSRDLQLSILRLVRVDRLQLLNSLLAVTEITHTGVVAAGASGNDGDKILKGYSMGVLAPSPCQW